MPEILYLPSAAKDEKPDHIRLFLEPNFSITPTESFLDATSILSLQHQNQAYAFDAFVAVQEVAETDFSGIRALRKACPAVPFIFLTTKKPLAPLKSMLLAAGADDCLPIRTLSPAIAQEIRATILRRILARHEYAVPEIEIGNTIIDLQGKSAACGAQSCNFNPQEWAIVESLALTFPRMTMTIALQQRIGRDSEANVVELLRAVMSGVRSKFRQIDSNIRVFNETRLGYRFAVE